VSRLLSAPIVGAPGRGVTVIDPSPAVSMVIRTEMMSQRAAMGRSDPFPAGFEIRFGGLNFQATGNVYHMRLLNRDGLHPWRSTGPGPIPVTPTTDPPSPATTVTTSTSRCRRRSGQSSCQARAERHREVHTTARGGGGGWGVGGWGGAHDIDLERG
jgi:hypothetical protein